MKQKKVFHLLWTSGLDSTYRLNQLSKEDVIIQLYYIINNNRKSLEVELQAMKEILDILSKKKSLKAEILPTIFMNKEDFFPIPEEVHQAYLNLRKQFSVGDQYEWLALVGMKIPHLEMSLERATGDSNRFFDNIPASNSDLYDEGVFAYYKLREDNPRDLFRIFGHFHYPATVARLTKKEMYQEMISTGDADIYEKTWFCSFPIEGEACGYCGPCRLVAKEGMGFRFSINTQKRYKKRWLWLIRHKALRILGKL